MITGFIIHFYITFGTNLLTGGPAPIAVFAWFLLRRILVPNGVQTQQNVLEIFLDQKTPWGPIKHQLGNTIIMLVHSA